MRRTPARMPHGSVTWDNVCEQVVAKAATELPAIGIANCGP
jgi:hypothetical protein